MNMISNLAPMPTEKQRNGAQLVAKKMTNAELSDMEKAMALEVDHAMLQVPAPFNLHYSKLMLDTVRNELALRNTNQK